MIGKCPRAEAVLSLPRGVKPTRDGRALGDRLLRTIASRMLRRLRRGAGRTPEGASEVRNGPLPVVITPKLHLVEQKVTSQFGEDGVLAQIASDLNIDRGTFFEFGIGPPWGSTFEEKGLEGNFVHLRNRGWQGVFVDGCQLPARAGVFQDFITPMNINRIWEKYNIPENLDFLSIDVDGQEFWIWLALARRPKVVVVEYNGSLAANQSITIQFDASYVWDETVYHGASLRALEKLAKSKNYTLVWANGVNAVFVQDELLKNKDDFVFDDIFRSWPAKAPDILNRAWVAI